MILEALANTLTGDSGKNHKPRTSLTCGALCMNRGDWTRLELFLAGIRGWEDGLHGQVNGRQTANQDWEGGQLADASCP